jgi:membrane-bound transcription factor site-1 protease
MYQYLSKVILKINIFQGSGKLNIINAYNLLIMYKPKITFFPNELDFTYKNTYMWPFSSQQVYHNSMPLIVNVTILNGINVFGKIIKKPIWKPGKNGQNLSLTFQFSKILWYIYNFNNKGLGKNQKLNLRVGYLSIFINVNNNDYVGLSEGNIIMNIKIPNIKKIFEVILPLKINIIKTPLRNQRILWDQYHNLQYPTNFYIPRDNLNIKDDVLDWNGDHLHTNFKEMYNFLKSKNYFIEILLTDYTKFNASNYGTLLMVDLEEEFTLSEKIKLKDDIENKGLSIAIFADWYYSIFYFK